MKYPTKQDVSKWDICSLAWTISDGCTNQRMNLLLLFTIIRMFKCFFFPLHYHWNLFAVQRLVDLHLSKRRTGISFGVFIVFLSVWQESVSFFKKKKKGLPSKEGANPWLSPPHTHTHSRTHTPSSSPQRLCTQVELHWNTHDTLSTKRLIAALQTAATDPSTSSTIDASDKELSQKINCTRYREVCTRPNYDAVCVWGDDMVEMEQWEAAGGQVSVGWRGFTEIYMLVAQNVKKRKIFKNVTLPRSPHLHVLILFYFKPTN